MAGQPVPARRRPLDPRSADHASPHQVQDLVAGGDHGAMSDDTAASEEFESELVAVGLGAFAAELAALRQPSVRLHAVRAVDQVIEPGASKLGGQPDLPRETRWPTFRSRPLAFVAQVNLAEVSGLEGAALLPDAGLLSFFYEAADQNVWGFDPADRGGWAVVFTPPGNPTQRAQHPAGVAPQDRYRAARLQPTSEVTYAPWGFPQVEQHLTDPETWEAYEKAVAATTAHDQTATDPVIHRLLGHQIPSRETCRPNANWSAMASTAETAALTTIPALNPYSSTRQTGSSSSSKSTPTTPPKCTGETPDGCITGSASKTSPSATGPPPGSSFNAANNAPDRRTPADSGLHRRTLMPGIVRALTPGITRRVSVIRSCRV